METQFSQFFSAMIASPGWLIAAKIVLSLILLAISFFGINLLLQARQVYDQLVYLEKSAELERDNAMFGFMTARADLRDLKERLQARPEPVIASQPFLNPQVMSDAGALLMLVLQKETSLLKWGLMGAKIGKSVYKYVKTLKNK